MTETNNTELVRAAQQGCVESFSRLYEQTYADMVWLAYSVVWQWEWAEDIAQESYAVVCRKLVHLKRPERFMGWLAAICRHRAVDALRSRQVKTVSLEQAVEQTSPERVSGDGELVRDAVARLPQMYREVVVLFYFHGMSYQQLQQVLGVSQHTVKGRLARARKKLGSLLESESHE